MPGVHVRLSKIRKRDGRVVEFEKERITKAIFRAFQTVDEGSLAEAEQLTDKIVKELGVTLDPGKIPTVEEIQDLVETELILADYAKTVKSYILYRKAHENIRHTKGAFVEEIG